MAKVAWSFIQAWNESFDALPARVAKPRDYLYASELLWSPTDIFHKMKGIQPSNPPNDRSLRKFEVGNLMEWVIKQVLLRTGLLRGEQIKVDYALPGCIPVHGRLDFLAGGKIDYEKGLYEINHMGLPEFWNHAARIILKHFKEKYGDQDLEEYVQEVKSISSFMFQVVERRRKPIRSHVPQLFHYVHGLNLKQGKLCYFSKDDLLTSEFSISNDAAIFAEYQEFIKLMTDYYQTDTAPPLEKPILWDPLTCKFAKNIKVEYSSYLTMLYGHATPEAFRTPVEKQVKRWNGTLTRCVEGKKMTDLNKEVIAEAKLQFPNWDELVYDTSINGVVMEENEGEAA